MKKFYITNAIPYVNAKPHIGFALEICQSDVIARYHRLIGDDVRFLAGTDDNSLKNVQAAEKEGASVKSFVDKNAKAFSDLKDALNLSYDDFIRTTEKRHFEGAQKLWEACKKDIYKKKYKGLYCVGCEEFKKEEDLVPSALRHKKEGQPTEEMFFCCPEHPNQKIEKIEEENYFFKLTNYQKQLEKIIENDEYKIIPESRKNEALSFIKQGLEDFSISRSKERAHGWGVPVPGDPSQVMYVWFDALSNYINALDYAGDQKLFKKYWPADVHIIGKGILKFHAVYWPAILLSAGISLPKKLFAHGYVTVNGRKISKSLGNVIDPVEIVNKYGQDAVRYFLLREIPSYSDGDFSISKFEERYDSDLANGLGNLVSRTFAMVEKYFEGKVPEIKEDPETHPLRVGKDLYTWKDAYADCGRAWDEYKFSECLSAVMKFIATSDKYIDENKPWKLAKEEKKEELAWVLYGLLDGIHQLAWMIYPFMPETSLKIAKAMNIEGLLKINPQEKDSWTNIKSGTKISLKWPLFPRLEK